MSLAWIYFLQAISLLVPHVARAADPITYRDLTNPYLIPPYDEHPITSPGVTQYLVFHSGLAANFTAARDRCRALGGDLADVESPALLAYLAARLHGPAFVASWLGSHMGFACMAVFPGGAIAVPEEGCVGRIGSICEVPLFGTATIHIGARPDRSSDLARDFPDAKAKPVSNQAAIKPQTNPDGIEIYRDGRRAEQQKLDKSAGKTVTMTIYGSIATNPVLPCCRCC